MQLVPARVTAVLGPFVAVSTLGTGQPYKKLCRPVMCGVTTGLHYMPRVNERVWVAYLEQALPTVLCGLSNFFPSTGAGGLIDQLPTLAEGETAIFGPTGNVLRTIASGNVDVGNPTATFKSLVLDGDEVSGSISGSSQTGGSVSGSFTGTVRSSATVARGN